MAGSSCVCRQIVIKTGHAPPSTLTDMGQHLLVGEIVAEIAVAGEKNCGSTSCREGQDVCVVGSPNWPSGNPVYFHLDEFCVNVEGEPTLIVVEKQFADLIVSVEFVGVLSVFGGSTRQRHALR